MSSCVGCDQVDGTIVCAYRVMCSCMVLDAIQRWLARCIRREREARLYRHVGLWVDGVHRCNLVLATVQGAKDSWAVVTDEPPTLQTLWQYALR
jgi:hypothetical protein